MLFFLSLVQPIFNFDGTFINGIAREIDIFLFDSIYIRPYRLFIPEYYAYRYSTELYDILSVVFFLHYRDYIHT